MHLAYSAISIITDPNKSKPAESANERLLRYQAYRQTCDKFNHEIAAIQKYIPGWLPKFK